MSISPHIQSILETLPEKPGVYQHFNEDGEIIYVGKAKNLRKRVHSYFQKDHPSFKTRQLVRNIADIKYIVVANEQDAFLLENNLIKKYQPHYNILLKDGKTYPSICITREPYPRVFKTRNIDKRIGDYYGPYSFGNTVDLVLQLIGDLYPLRTCRIPMTEDGVMQGKYKICLKYHIKKCCGVCENYATRQEYLDFIEEIRKIIRGDAAEILRHLMEQMQSLAAELRFEEAAELKRKYDLVERFQSKTIVTRTHLRDTDVLGYDENDEHIYVSILRVHQGSIVAGQTIEYKRIIEEDKAETLGRAIIELQEQIGSTTKELIVPFLPDFIEENYTVTIPQRGDSKRLLELAMENVRQYKADRLRQSDKLNPDQRAMRILGKLQTMLGLTKMPLFIDSFDNSNIQGTSAVAACVVFKKAKPSKSDYKRFNIKTVVGADDYASMREVVYRRYHDLVEANEPLPDLILADGGVGQMNAIREAVEDQLGLSIPIAGMVKNDRHRTSTLLYGFPPQEVGLKVTDEVFHFITQVQDEVHRFAITFHRKKRSKLQTVSELDEIHGIGEKTKKMLLQHLKSVKRIRIAEITELEKLIGKHKASIVYEHFHGKISG